MSEEDQDPTNPLPDEMDIDLDMPKVLARFECGGRFKYYATNGSVFRIGR